MIIQQPISPRSANQKAAPPPPPPRSNTRSKQPPPQSNQRSQQAKNKMSSFRSKFNLPANEHPLECTPYFVFIFKLYFINQNCKTDYTLASGCYLYISESYVCIESLFSGNEAVKISEIVSMHKSKPGLLGKGTGGRIVLRNGKVGTICFVLSFFSR